MKEHGCNITHLNSSKHVFDQRVSGINFKRLLLAGIITVKVVKMNTNKHQILGSIQFPYSVTFIIMLNNSWRIQDILLHHVFPFKGRWTCYLMTELNKENNFIY